VASAASGVVLAAHPDRIGKAATTAARPSQRASTAG